MYVFQTSLSLHKRNSVHHSVLQKFQSLSLRYEQNGTHIVYDIFKCILLTEIFTY